MVFGDYELHEIEPGVSYLEKKEKKFGGEEKKKRTMQERGRRN
jgi:hypothetical protein